MRKNFLDGLLVFDPLRFCRPAPMAEQRRAAISAAAYLRASERQFAPGHDIEDWLAAEAEWEQRQQSTAVSVQKA